MYEIDREVGDDATILLFWLIDVSPWDGVSILPFVLPENDYHGPSSKFVHEAVYSQVKIVYFQ